MWRGLAPRPCGSYVLPWPRCAQEQGLPFLPCYPQDLGLPSAVAFSPPAVKPYRLSSFCPPLLTADNLGLDSEPVPCATIGDIRPELFWGLPTHSLQLEAWLQTGLCVFLSLLGVRVWFSSPSALAASSLPELQQTAQSPSVPLSPLRHQTGSLYRIAK